MKFGAIFGYELDEAGDSEAGDLDGEGGVDISGKGEPKFFEGVDLADNFGSEAGLSPAPGGADQVGDNVFANANQLACQGG